jgi:hypothetical protein
MLHRGYLTASGWRYIDSTIIYIIRSHIETRRPTLNISLPNFVLPLKLSTLLIARIADLHPNLPVPPQPSRNVKALASRPAAIIRRQDILPLTDIVTTNTAHHHNDPLVLTAKLSRPLGSGHSITCTTGVRQRS